MDDFIMGTYQKKLWREMNDYAEDTGMEERFTPKYVREKFSESEAKKLVQDHTLGLMFADYVSENRKKKPSKTKSKRKKKSNGCGCK